ncbi:MAG: serine hydrolase domain-containing protein [Bacteroidota bacterium]
MRTLLSLMIVSMVAVTFVAAQGRPISENTEIATNLKLMERWIEAQRVYRNLPGLSVALVHDQDLIYARGFGLADLEDEVPATAQTMYRVASITKTLTATAVMQLRDQGKLRLDDPIERHLPWFRIKNRFPNAPAMTIRHLLTHTSGLPRESAYPYWTDYKFPSRSEMIKALEQQETVFPTETRLKYSNLGVVLAGEIVAEISGIPYSEYVAKNILEPLGMSSTTVYFQDKDRDRLAVGYGRRMENGSRREMPFLNARAIAASANLTSTVEDLAKFASLQFREGHVVFGSQILRGSTLKEMHRVQWLNPTWNGGWGLGFDVTRKGEKTVVGHGGWIRGYRSQLSLLPEDKIAVIVLTNADDADAGYFADHILSMMLPYIKRATAGSMTVSIVDPGWVKYTGKYEDPWSYEYEILQVNGRLVLYGHNYPPEDDPRRLLVELTPEGPNTFRMIGGNEDGELIIFEMDSGNKVAKVKIGENFIYPKKDK